MDYNVTLTVSTCNDTYPMRDCGTDGAVFGHGTAHDSRAPPHDTAAPSRVGLDKSGAGIVMLWYRGGRAVVDTRRDPS